MTLQAAGNVGIGTIAPNQKLEVQGTARIQTPSTAGYAEILSNANGPIYTGNGDLQFYTNNSAYNTRFFSANRTDELFTILNSGNVGIGTTAPANKLDVITSAGSGPVVRIAGTAVGAGGALQLADGTTNSSYSLVNGSAGSFSVGDNLAFMRGAGELMRITNGGNVGVGTTAPDEKLSVSGAIRVTSNANNWNTQTSGIIDYYLNNMRIVAGAPASTSNGMTFITTNSGANVNAMQILGNGNVGIGTTSPSEKFSVNGNIRSKKLIVTQTGWSDYVFYKNYRLKPLSEVEAYIKANKHLPDVPSAKKVETDGIDVGENQALLLKKIEELTLYMIEIKKENERMKNDNQQIKKENSLLNNRIKKLENKK